VFSRQLLNSETDAVANGLRRVFSVSALPFGGGFLRVSVFPTLAPTGKTNDKYDFFTVAINENKTQNKQRIFLNMLLL